MAGPIGFPSNAGSGVDQMMAQIRALVRDEIRAAASGGAGLHVDGATGDLVADRGQFRSLNYVPGSAGWGLQPNGNAEFNVLTLRGGIIGNDALTSPVAPGVLYTSATNFALSTTSTARASITVTVPAGFTSAAITATGRILAFNPNITGGAGSGTDYLYSQVNIGAYSGYGLPLVVVGSGSSDINSATFSTILPGLVAGNTFVVSVTAATSFLPWAANANNTAELSGSVQWYR